MMATAYINSPLGILKLQAAAEGLCEVAYEEGEEISISQTIPDELQAAVFQLGEYFEGKRREFSLKLSPQGTAFQKRVWNKLLAIPFGKTATYQEMAQALGDPKTIRAAASANGRNPIAIIIPCHRVIGSDGSLTGYAGGLHRKKWLLEHESPVVQQSLF